MGVAGDNVFVRSLQLVKDSYHPPSLIRIDHWDWEKERLILLSDNNLISVKYNFIVSVVEELKFIPLQLMVEVVHGEFNYTNSYVL